MSSVTKKIIISFVIIGSFALGIIVSPYIFPLVIPSSKEVYDVVSTSNNP